MHSLRIEPIKRSPQAFCRIAPVRTALRDLVEDEDIGV
jgi:hypothetical protein